jgi:hypothetical protein
VSQPSFLQMSHVQCGILNLYVYWYHCILLSQSLKGSLGGGGLSADPAKKEESENEDSDHANVREPTKYDRLTIVPVGKIDSRKVPVRTKLLEPVSSC